MSLKIEEFAEFICSTFGQRSMSFHINVKILNQILEKEITEDVISELQEQMIEHSYIVMPSHAEVFTFLHFGVLNSLRLLDDDSIIEDVKDFKKENGLDKKPSHLKVLH